MAFADHLELLILANLASLIVDKSAVKRTLNNGNGLTVALMNKLLNKTRLEYRTRNKLIKPRKCKTNTTCVAFELGQRGFSALQRKSRNNRGFKFYPFAKCGRSKLYSETQGSSTVPTKQNGRDLTVASTDIFLKLQDRNLNYSQHRLISPRLIEHSRNITNFLGTGRPH